MNINIKAFGIARDILNTDEMAFEIENKASVDDLKMQLTKAFPEFERLRKFSIAVNQEYREDDFIISQNDEVVIIPPVSGG